MNCYVFSQKSLLSALSNASSSCHFDSPIRHRRHQIRGFASNKTRQGSKKQGQKSTRKSVNILARRPDDIPDPEVKDLLPDQQKEKYLANLQNQVQDSYKSGSYRKGLEDAMNYLEAVEEHFREKKIDMHPAIASALSDVGLFHKLLGNYDDARKSYKRALPIYKKVVGVDHANYASLLHNLGNLNRIQVHLDGDLKPSDRLTLMEEAEDYLSQAYAVRLAERGPHHPHTVASQSSWGATLAMQILHYYKKQTTSSGASVYVNTLTNQAPAWDAAEDHLRRALKTAIDNPRGTSLKHLEREQQQQQQYSKKKDNEKVSTASGIQTLSAASAAQNLAIFLKIRATTISTLSAKDVQLPEKLEEAVEAQHKRLSNSKQKNTTRANHGGFETENYEKDASVTTGTENSTSVDSTLGDESSVSQENDDNKSMADTAAAANDDGAVAAKDEAEESPPNAVAGTATTLSSTDQQKQQARAWFEEAHSLYKDVLAIRKALLPKLHADLYATQHSLAELLEAMGDVEAANALRQEMIDTYDPQPAHAQENKQGNGDSDSDKKADSDSNNDPPLAENKENLGGDDTNNNNISSSDSNYNDPGLSVNQEDDKDGKVPENSSDNDLPPPSNEKEEASCAPKNEPATS